MENSKTILEQKEEIGNLILEAELDIKNFLEEGDAVQHTIDEYIAFRDMNKQLIKFKTDEERVSKDINGLINKLSTLETQEVKLNGELLKVTQLISDYLENEKQIEKNKEIRTQIQEVRTNLTTAKAESDKVNKLLLGINGEVSTLKSQKETIEERIKEVEELEEQFGLYEYYLNALGKDGISYELISKALPMIEGEVNNILGQIVEFGVQLDMDGKNINANIVYDDQKWSLEMCSGMEKFISGLAIRIALINVCNLPRPNFLVIDEGFGTLDNENLTSLYMLFAYLKTQFDFVMLISHIDSMRDVVDTLMEIKKVNGYSHIKF
jgi:DNA repair exonuclease SbcCD ATPase subunit